jgi:hypothetical protein
LLGRQCLKVTCDPTGSDHPELAETLVENAPRVANGAGEKLSGRGQEKQTKDAGCIGGARASPLQYRSVGGFRMDRTAGLVVAVSGRGSDAARSASLRRPSSGEASGSTWPVQVSKLLATETSSFPRIGLERPSGGRSGLEVRGCFFAAFRLNVVADLRAFPETLEVSVSRRGHVSERSPVRNREMKIVRLACRSAAVYWPMHHLRVCATKLRCVLSPSPSHIAQLDGQGREDQQQDTGSSHQQPQHVSPSQSFRPFGMSHRASFPNSTWDPKTSFAVMLVRIL